MHTVRYFKDSFRVFTWSLFIKLEVLLSSLRQSLDTTIGQKLLMAVTGLGLIGFVIAHLSGNLLLYVGLDAYNEYAYALHSNEILLHVFEIGLLALFVLHIFYAIRISQAHRKARPQGYVKRASKQNRSKLYASNIMLFSGLVVLGFVLLHLADLRFNLRHPVGPNVEPATHTLLVLQDPISGTVYFLGSLFLGYHLWHAFQSLFQTLGLNHHRYTPWIKRLGVFLAVVLGLGFASFPVWGLLIRLGVLS